MLTMLTNIYSIVISIVATRSGEILDPSATLGMTVAGKLTNIYKKKHPDMRVLLHPKYSKKLPI